MTLTSRKKTLVRRKKLGQCIASERNIKKVAGVWRVPSDTRNNTYEVKRGLKGLFCNCSDYLQHYVPCKHVFAVEALLEEAKTGKRIKPPSSASVRRPTYPQDWRTYNEAQMFEKEGMVRLLTELCAGVPEPVRGPGNPKARLKDVVFAATMKVYGTFSGRRTSSELRSCQDKGLVRKAPHYNTISKYLNDSKLTPILLGLIRECTKPLKEVESVFAADSTGIGTFQISRWFDEKFGAKARRREWIKIHICVGVDTHIVTDVKITNSNSHDTNYFKPLIKETAKIFDIKEISADKAYLSRTNLEAARSAGAQAFIPPKKNSTGGSSKILKDHITKARDNLVEFNARYHQRSNVESAIQMIKSKFQEGVRSKNRTAKVNEALCKILCHNLSVLVHYEVKSGVEATFWSDVA